MKQLTFLLGIICLSLLASSCNHFDTIEGSTTRRVVYIRPYAFFNRNIGGHIHEKVLGPGQWNHGGAGPIIGYDFDVAQEQFESNNSVIMKDKLAINTTWVWQYRLKDDPVALKDLLFNFTPLEAIASREKDDKYEIQRGNDLATFKITSDIIFKTYAAVFADQAFKDVLCKNNSSSLNTEEVAQNALENAKKALASIVYPKFVTTPEGAITYTGKDSINILDVIEITGVTFNKYAMPEEVSEIISEVNDMRSAYQARLKDKERIKISAETKVEKASLMQKKNVLMEQIIKNNPNVLQFAAQQKLSDLLKAEGIKAKLIVIPENGTEIHVN